jgi:hypothetical protein
MKSSFSEVRGKYSVNTFNVYSVYLKVKQHQQRVGETAQFKKKKSHLN